MTENFFKGMQFAFKRSSSPVAYCAISVRAGTRDEKPNLAGIAHFTEHVLFKGTEFKSASTINSYVEKLGGELNAYTTKEETVLHCTVLREDISKAINLLVEIAFCSIFPEKELNKEKVVILDEINSYKDSPSEQIFDDFEELLFAGSALSTPVLGKAKTIKKIGVNDIKEYYHKEFVPSNMSFSVVADMDESKVRGILLKALNKYCTLDLPLTEKVTIPRRVPYSPSSPFSKSVLRRNHQVHCIIGGYGCSFYSPQRLPLILLVNILGGPAANSRLNLLLREKNALVYNVEASFNQYSDTGVVTIYFGCDKNNFDKCHNLVLKELKYFRENKVSEKFLKESVKQLLGQLAISSDNGEAQCLSMGKSLLVFGRVIETEEVRKMLEGITAEEIQSVAQEFFSEERLSKIIFV